jgi:transketolase
MSDLPVRSKHIRREMLKIGLPVGIYHWGGSFSVCEILIALYDHVLKSEDQCIVSKGHGWLAQAVLLRERGYDPTLTGHPVRDPKNGIWATTGSLGHGLPISIGMALAKKMRGQPGRVFVIIGDGESQEGTLYESLRIAVHQRLTNLTVIVDMNGIQGSGYVADIQPVTELDVVGAAIGCSTHSIDGHDTEALAGALDDHSGLVRLFMAHTIKGRGVSFMEGTPEWHARYPSDSELARIHTELE